MTVGERIKKLRLQRGLSPVELAAAAGVTDSAIHQLEQGLTKKPSFGTGLKIARALGVSAWEIAFGERAPDDVPPSEMRASTTQIAETTAFTRDSLAALWGTRLETRVNIAEPDGTLDRRVIVEIPEYLPPVYRNAVFWFPMRDEFDAQSERLDGLQADLADAHRQIAALSGRINRLPSAPLSRGKKDGSS